MKEITTQIRCPACHGGMVPTELYCDACDIHVSGRFVQNEFVSLGEEDLHFLRIFVHCEGRIRDMESALGVSYPTIKARLAKLKEALAPLPVEEARRMPAAEESPEDVTAAVLKDLEDGRLTFEQAMARIKAQRATGEVS